MIFTTVMTVSNNRTPKAKPFSKGSFGEKDFYLNWVKNEYGIED
ncbi:hypothetical protein [Brumimicrobium mesophilum]|nr:hypothetical protein [Brumimicrobium mesophilum]